MLDFSVFTINKKPMPIMYVSIYPIIIMFTFFIEKNELMEYIIQKSGTSTNISLIEITVPRFLVLLNNKPITTKIEISKTVDIAINLFNFIF